VVKFHQTPCVHGLGKQQTLGDTSALMGPRRLYTADPASVWHVLDTVYGGRNQLRGLEEVRCCSELSSRKKKVEHVALSPAGAPHPRTPIC
jgi:hypothetical protein